MTRAFSWARPTNTMPSGAGAGQRARCAAITSSFRWPFSKLMSGTPCSCTKVWMAATNALLIGSISADEAKGCPRCRRKNADPALVLQPRDVGIQVHPVDALHLQRDVRDVLTQDFGDPP